MITTSSRVFLPYEYNHLKRYGIDPETIDASDTTPVEYLTGVVEFAGHVFATSPEALIPRVETEELVARATSGLAEQAALGTITWAELGTGSGALGLSVAWELSQQGLDHHGFLSDISSDALELAQANADQLEIDPTRLTFMFSDLFSAYPADLQFDLILANLPYIPSNRVEELDESVTDHEPHLALDGGPDGFSVIARLLEQLPSRLTPSGTAWLEIDHTHELLVWQQYLSSLQLWECLEVVLYPDQFGQNRFAMIRLRHES